MKPVLLLVDLQQDYLAKPGLEPAAGQIVDRAAELLSLCRRREVEVIHIWTTVRRDVDDRMPHWRERGVWQCVAGTQGHEPPAQLAPLERERIVHKRFFSGFEDPSLEHRLRELGCDAVIVAGVHLHACVRLTVLDAYQRGYAPIVVDDAVGSDDPIHAAITRRYLGRRGTRFVGLAEVEGILNGATIQPGYRHFAPADVGTMLWETRFDGPTEVERVCSVAAELATEWARTRGVERAKVLLGWAQRLNAAAGRIAAQIVTDIGKPSRMAEAEVARGVELLHLAAEMAAQELEYASGKHARYRYRPLGVAGIITPYNNPMAIPAGKVGPALAYGNAVVWKPAPAATGVARMMVDLAREAGLAEGVLSLCVGDGRTSGYVAEDPRVGGISVSGSSLAGYALQEVCARRHIPYQAELGGNNAAVVCDDVDLELVASQIAGAAFGFAGQRCTANRRAVVLGTCFDAFCEHLRRATKAMVWGDPHRPDTTIGPLISRAKQQQVTALVKRAKKAGHLVIEPHERQADRAELVWRGAYYPPIIVVAEDPASEIVQEESFGPILVVQRAAGLDEAISLCNGVRQGLVAAIFSRSAQRQEQFLETACAGVLKINQGTADADARSPLGGWKASGVGPAEHGPSDREFYCRAQSVYGES